MRFFSAGALEVQLFERWGAVRRASELAKLRRLIPPGEPLQTTPQFSMHFMVRNPIAGEFTEREQDFTAPYILLYLNDPFIGGAATGERLNRLASDSRYRSVEANWTPGLQYVLFVRKQP